MGSYKNYNTFGVYLDDMYPDFTFSYAQTHHITGTSLFIYWGIKDSFLVTTTIVKLPNWFGSFLIFDKLVPII